MVDRDGVEGALAESANLYRELKTRELRIIWEHSFQKVDANSGDGITSKFFEYTSGVTRSGADVHVPEGDWIQTKERGDYGAGQPVVAGAAGQYNQTPTGDQDGYVGYYDRSAGIGYGFGYQYFTDGEAGATAAGAQPYVYNEHDGEGRDIVPQENWNLHKLNGEAGEGPELDPTDGFTARLPHACYGHSAGIVAVGVKKDISRNLDGQGGLRRVRDAFEVYPVHVFNDRTQTMWTEFDLPIVWETAGTQANGFRLEATACHYEGETGRGIKRTNGETWTPQKNGGTQLSLGAYPDWTYIMGFRKRSGWETASVTPLALSFNCTQNTELMIARGGSLSNTDYQRPTQASTEETAVEYDLGVASAKANDTTIDTLGEQEWIDVVPGDKQDPIDIKVDFENVVLSGQEPLYMVARPATSTAGDVRYAAMRSGGGF